jgi:holliday junction DNA helicase RuvA
MLASLQGQVTAHDERSLTLDVHGIGFRVFVLPRAIEQFPIGSTASITTHLHVREDAVELYGFSNQEEQRLFEKLISVSGVGPRLALGVLSAASVADLENAIDRGQAGLLTKVSGVGTKTAERIIVDLKGKLMREESAGDGSMSTVIDALANLGYTAREAREAAAATSSDLPVEQRVKQALRRIGR